MNSKETVAALVAGLKNTVNQTVTVLISQVEATGKPGADLVAASKMKSKTHVCLNRVALIEAIEKKPAA